MEKINTTKYTNPRLTIQHVQTVMHSLFKRDKHKHKETKRMQSLISAYFTSSTRWLMLTVWVTNARLHARACRPVLSHDFVSISTV